MNKPPASKVVGLDYYYFPNMPVRMPIPVAVCPITGVLYAIDYIRGNGKWGRYRKIQFES